MIDSAVITLAILLVAVIGFVSNRLPLIVVAMFVPLTLWATGVLDLQSTLAGFSDPIVIFIATLFVIGEALDVLTGDVDRSGG